MTDVLLNYQYLLFSYHGVPERHIRKSDVTKSHCKIDKSCCNTPSEAHAYCYKHQCVEVTRLVGEYLKLEPDTFSTSFQSRLGFDPWLRPYTDRTIERLGKDGIKNIDRFRLDKVILIRETTNESSDLSFQKRFLCGSTNWSLNIDTETGENLSILYPTFGVVYVNKANRFQLRYVKQVEGIVCSGGVCRLEPAFSGVRFNVSSNF